MKRKDIVLALGILAFASLLYMVLLFGQKPGTAVTITADGKEQVLSLSEDGTMEIKGYKGGTCVLKIQDGKVCILEADCPDHSCVKQGWIQRSGETIACLPNRVLVVINGSGSSQKSAFDSIAK